MDRLTQRTEAGASLKLDNPANAEEARQQVKEKFMLACNRLAEYEDTGLTPEEILQMKAMTESINVDERLAELVELKKKIADGRMVEVVRCEDCIYYPDDCGYDCRYCSEGKKEAAQNALKGEEGER